MSTISVCCITRGPTGRVAAQLGVLRDVADEIVVALDTSVDAELVAPLEHVADTLVRYPYADPVDRPVGWVHSLCTKDWILWVDDDEIPSAGLLQELRRVVGGGELTHCFVPRRTLWRDAATVLAGPPWVPDYQLRFVRNDPPVLWFPGITHWPIEAIGPHRFLTAPLYHTDLLLTPVDRRRAKVRRYERVVPGRRVAGLPMNDAYFLPEDRGYVRTAPITEEDRENVRRLLAIDPWPDRQAPKRPLRLASRKEIDAHWRGAPTGEELYRARLEVVDDLDPFAAGEKRGITVRIENRGSHVWPPSDLGWPRVRATYRWLTDVGKPLVADGLRTPLPAALAPGESLLALVDVVAPRVPGEHRLVLDLLHEHIRWFGCEVERHVHVRPAGRVAIVGDDLDLAAAAAAYLADAAPEIVPVLLAGEPEAAHERLGYETAADLRAYILGADSPRSTLGVVGRGAVLVAEAALARVGRGTGRAPFLEVLRDVDALLVVGDAALRGRYGKREAWQRGSAVLAAAALGLEVVVVSSGNGVSPLGRVAQAVAIVVQPPPGGGPVEALHDAVQVLVGQLG